jgi:ribosomal protein S18 acetylase RimI-like enzyme
MSRTEDIATWWRLPHPEVPVDETRIIPTEPGGPSLTPIWDDYRKQYSLSETAVLNPLIDALATRRVTALVVVRADRAVGGILLSQQGKEGRIHLLHTLKEAARAEPALLKAAEDVLTRTGEVERISATLPLLSESTLEHTFRQAGYRVFSRARLLLDLDKPLPPIDLPTEYRLTPWEMASMEVATTLIEAAHRDTDDANLEPELTGIKGAQLLLKRTSDGEFGPFDPPLSPMVFAREQLVGLSLAVWHIALPGQGFVVDLIVDAAHRRRGLGRALVTATAQAFRSAGATSLGLAVTLSNLPALHLYKALGFRIEQRFSLFRRQVETVPLRTSE